VSSVTRSFFRHKHPARTAAIAAVAAAATLGLTLPRSAIALTGFHGGAVPAPPASPTSADQIQNLDQVKTAIKGYYGDTVTTTPNPVDGTTLLHQFSPTGAYAAETSGIARGAEKYLAHEAKPNQKHTGTPAILFDIDDTTLNTYEIYSSFVYNPPTNAAFVNAGSASVFPAVELCADLHHDPVQVADPQVHRVARLRHRRQLRRPVQRPQRRLR